MKKKRVFLKKFSEAMRFVAVMTLIVFVTQSGVVWAAPATASLSTVPNPVLGVNGSGMNADGTLPATMTVPPHLAPYIKDMRAAIMLGKALFWDMQAGSDGVTACATCHHRAGVDAIKHAEDNFSIRDKNELNPGFDNSFNAVSPLTNAAILPNSVLTAGDFDFTKGIVARVAPAAGTNTFTLTPGVTGFDDVVGSQGVVKTDFVDVAIGSRKDNGKAPATPDGVFVAGGVNVRQVTGRNTPSSVNAVFNFQNFWDGRAHNIFNGNNPIGPMDAGAAGIFRNVGVGGIETLINEKVAIPNASLASQAVGPPLSNVEMSFGGRTFPQLGKKMLSLTPLGIQQVSPNDSVLGTLSNAPVGKGLNTTYPKMIQAAFIDNLWNSTQSTPNGLPQMEANFSLFWGLAIMAYEATQVSDKTPFDLALVASPANPCAAAGGLPTAVPVIGFVNGNPGFVPATGNAQTGCNNFKNNCDVCHSGNEMTTASVSNIVGSGTNTAPANPANNPGGVVDTAFARTTGASDTGFANIGVRPTGEDSGRGATTPNFPFPLSFAAQASTGKVIPGITAAAGIAQGAATQVNASFKVPGLRNVELTGPYFHNGSVDRLGDVLDLYGRGGNFDNLERSTAMGNGIGVANGNVNKANMVAFMLSLTDPRVKLEQAPFDHPELIIPNGEPEAHNMLRMPAKDKNGVAETPISTVTATVPATTNRGHPVINGEKEAGADVTISVNGNVALTPDIVTDTTFTTTLTGLHAGNNTVTITATDMTGGVKTVNKAIVVAFPSGVISGGTAVSVNDALKALKIALGLVTPAASDLANGDVAPLVGGLPNPDGQINVADAVVILRLAVGLEQF